jgi:hypothetical protein
MPEFVHWLLAHPVRWVVPAVLLVSVLGVVLALCWERRRPSSFTRRRTDDLPWWGLLSAEEQEAVDTAVLGLAEEAELDARQNAAESAEFLAGLAQHNALFHP